MSQHNWWARVWTLNDSCGDGASLIPRGNRFWLEPVSVDGSLTFFYLRFEPGEMNECFRNMRLYPLGVIQMKKAMLPAWKYGDELVRKQFMQEAVEVKTEGRDNPLFKRLEGTFWSPPDNAKQEQEIVRFYYLPGIECGRDWFVFDIISPGEVLEQDGTGHGDEE